MFFIGFIGNLKSAHDPRRKHRCALPFNVLCMENAVFLWAGFHAFILLMLVLDLGFFRRRSREVTIREALAWSGVWISLALLFNLFIYYYFDSGKALAFFTGYLIEKSLSVDNIFVIIVIFSYFHVPSAYQHKVLFWGILGALVMRVIFIVTGIGLIHHFEWLLYVFGAFLVFTGIKMLVQDEGKIQPERNPLLRLARRIFPVTRTFKGDRFFVIRKGKYWATPLFLVVILIETTDLLFALDSIPAILSISNDPFIVYTSNVFAILGLRSLYFVVAGVEKYFVYLKYGLSAILVFVGAKMSIANWFEIPVTVSLIVIAAILAVAMVASVVARKKEGGSESDLPTVR